MIQSSWFEAQEQSLLQVMVGLLIFPYQLITYHKRNWIMRSYIIMHLTLTSLRQKYQFSAKVIHFLCYETEKGIYWLQKCRNFFEEMLAQPVSVGGPSLASSNRIYIRNHHNLSHPDTVLHKKLFQPSSFEKYNLGKYNPSHPDLVLHKKLFQPSRFENTVWKNTV